ncbi:MAG: Gfo/Idh/MocA family oxidoreductase [Planctomycetota bacterium]
MPRMVGQPDIDLVVVPTPNQLHSEHAIAVLRAGKHVVCEKPIAKSAAEADRMIAATEDASRTLAVFQKPALRAPPAASPARHRFGGAWQSGPGPDRLARFFPAMGLADATIVSTAAWP